MPHHKDDWPGAKARPGDSPAGAEGGVHPSDDPEGEAAGEAAASDATAEHAETAERERWLRDYIDREQRFRLFAAKYLVGLLKHPPLWMRVWRWLIDDVRSERRAEAALLLGRPRAGLLPWLRDRRRRRPGR
jgi:hypothetical protein